jgi:hypothetical protein
MYRVAYPVSIDTPTNRAAAFAYAIRLEGRSRWLPWRRNGELRLA